MEAISLKNEKGLAVEGPLLMQPIVFDDERGCFFESWNARVFDELIGTEISFSQDNVSQSSRGVLRGLHYQKPPSAELKIITCLRGEIFDVAVDLRKNSPTFLHWHGEFLTEKNKASLIIPEGFAHGFQTLTDTCVLIYFHTKAYDKAAEAGINALEPRLKIKWPMAITDRSERDAKQPFLGEQFAGLVL